MTNKKESKFIKLIWPIEPGELKKFMFLCFLMFCVLCIQNLIRALKDSIIATMIGAESISFLKLWGVLPASMIFSLIYIKLADKINVFNFFNYIVSFFLIFFALFAYLFLPYNDYFHINEKYTLELIQQHPHLKWFVLLISKWSFSIFYIIAELWQPTVIALLFWQFVNQNTNVEQSKRFYPLFGLFGQTGLIISGIILSNNKILNLFITNFFNLKSDSKIISVQISLTIVLIFGLLSIVSFYYINKNIIGLNSTKIKLKKKKSTVSLIESLKIVASSKYVLLIAVLLICYGSAIQLVEGPWKSKASQIYQNPAEYAAFVGGYLKYTGMCTISLAFLCSIIVRKLGWLFAAIITPLVLFTTGLIFFLICNEMVDASIIAIFAISDPLLLAVSIGAIQNVLTKSTKYTLFDSTKEMLYVPLDENLKIKGKAAVDVIGTKLGKSFGALTQSAIFIIFPSLSFDAITPYLMICFCVICVIWLIAVLSLSKEYNINLQQ